MRIFRFQQIFDCDILALNGIHPFQRYIEISKSGKGKVWCLISQSEFFAGTKYLERIENHKKSAKYAQKYA